ncbi:MAG: S1-like domain-containing RNA-binding protein [Victivallaceae bacterium]|nr:S1-like domain-containing RNA-binding protein [Victivallaceae bacterium]
MIDIGQVNFLKLARICEFGGYLQDETRESVLLPRKYLPERCRVGDSLRVFVYCDSEDRPVATTRIPKAVAGEFAVLECRELTKIGAFLDWGLEKDLLVPFAQMRNKSMRPGTKYLVKVLFDQTSRRLIGSNRFDRLARAEELPKPGEEVEVIADEPGELGLHVVVNGKFTGLIYRDNLHANYATGEKFSGHVFKVRSDRRLDIVPGLPGHGEALEDEAQELLQKLKALGGFYAYNAKTPPTKIAADFNWSKRRFKELLGNLYKARKIEITEAGVKVLP